MKQSAGSLIEAKIQILNYIARKNCPNKSQIPKKQPMTKKDKTEKGAK